VERDSTLLRRLHLVAGTAIFVVLCAPWFVAVSLANPEFPNFFFVHEHFARYASTVHHRAGPFWYFVPILLVGLLPWTSLAGAALRDAWRARPPRGEFDVQRFLLIWIVTVFVFFSASSSKLPAYALPIVPALALLIGLRVTRMDDTGLLRHLVPNLLAAAGMLLLAAGIMTRAQHGADAVPLYGSYAGWLRHLAIGLMVGAGLLAILRRLPVPRALALVFLALVAEQAGIAGFERLSPLSSAYATAQQIRPYLGPDTRVYNVGRYDQTLPPYLRKPVVLVTHADELAFGLKTEPARWLADFSDFEREWASDTDAIAVMTPALFERAVADGMPVVVLARTQERIVVRKRG
jgi:4-amino-4-deoxy-L-arabinose transferase-like glycosyltransferase